MQSKIVGGMHSKARYILNQGHTARFLYPHTYILTCCTTYNQLASKCLPRSVSKSLKVARQAGRSLYNMPRYQDMRLHLPDTAHGDNKSIQNRWNLSTWRRTRENWS